MEKEIFELLGKYNKNSDIQMNNVIKNITDEEWNKKFPSFWKSIHELCSHIFIGDYGWLKFLNSFVKINSLQDKYFDKDYQWDKIIFGNKDEYFTMRK
jgi:uncharacterized damage-inducible protein DinB